MSRRNVIQEDNTVCVCCWNNKQDSTKDMNPQHSNIFETTETSNNKVSLKAFNINKKLKMTSSKGVKTSSMSSLPLHRLNQTIKVNSESKIPSSRQDLLQHHDFSHQLSQKQFILPKSAFFQHNLRTNDENAVQKAKKAALMKSMIRNLQMINSRDQSKKPKKIVRLIDSQIRKINSVDNSFRSINSEQIQNRQQESFVIMNFFNPTEINLQTTHSPRRFKKDGIRVTNSIIMD